MGPLTKVLPIIKISKMFNWNPLTNIIIIDDDRLYQPSHIERLINSVKLHGNHYAYTCRGWKIMDALKYDEQGFDYFNFKNNYFGIKGSKISFLLFFFFVF